MITIQAFAIALSAVLLVTVRARRAPEPMQGSPGRYRVR
jgi:hypothetical protein